MPFFYKVKKSFEAQDFTKEKNNITVSTGEILSIDAQVVKHKEESFIIFQSFDRKESYKILLKEEKELENFLAEHLEETEIEIKKNSRFYPIIMLLNNNMLKDAVKSYKSAIYGLNSKELFYDLDANVMAFKLAKLLFAGEHHSKEQLLAMFFAKIME